MGKFEQALERYAKYVIQQSRSNLSRKKHNASGNLYKSLSYKIQANRVKFLSDEYGSYLDQGVRGAKSYYADRATSSSPFRFTNKMPPSRVFDKWTVRKGIAPRDKEGKFISRKSLNYLIARSIYRKGIRATLFFTKPFERGLDLYGDEIISGYIDDNLTI
tara:strand:- start:6277 stop:6759 length:483 start_codon:yes stop_codon:yes gene_type:complete